MASRSQAEARRRAELRRARRPRLRSRPRTSRPRPPTLPPARTRRPAGSRADARMKQGGADAFQNGSEVAPSKRPKPAQGARRPRRRHRPFHVLRTPSRSIRRGGAGKVAVRQGQPTSGRGGRFQQLHARLGCALDPPSVDAFFRQQRHGGVQGNAGRPVAPCPSGYGRPSWCAPRVAVQTQFGPRSRERRKTCPKRIECGKGHRVSGRSQLEGRRLPCVHRADLGGRGGRLDSEGGLLGGGRRLRQGGGRVGGRRVCAGRVAGCANPRQIRKNPRDGHVSEHEDTQSIPRVGAKPKPSCGVCARCGMVRCRSAQPAPASNGLGQAALRRFGQSLRPLSRPHRRARRIGLGISNHATRDPRQFVDVPQVAHDLVVESPVLHAALDRSADGLGLGVRPVQRLGDQHPGGVRPRRVQGRRDADPGCRQPLRLLQDEHRSTGKRQHRIRRQRRVGSDRRSGSDRRTDGARAFLHEQAGRCGRPKDDGRPRRSADQEMARPGRRLTERNSSRDRRACRSVALRSADEEP